MICHYEFFIKGERQERRLKKKKKKVCDKIRTTSWTLRFEDIYINSIPLKKKYIFLLVQSRLS